MEDVRLVSILTGKPRDLGGGSTPTWRSGICKEPADGPVWLGKTGLAGDGQADLKHHGGPDKAVLAYAEAHYPLWRKELDLSHFTPGATGENFVISRQTEEAVCIGDTYRIGKAVVQVSQPRQPCWKPARRWNIRDLTLRMQNTGRTGWYYRVLEEGYVEAGTEVILLDRPYPQWTISRCNEIMYHRRKDRESAAQLAACPLLSESWVRTLSKRAEEGSR
ncbi:MOSC domain-containing protein YiiM [Planifilum fimeticola]|jgi:MOSC domain-containing protein YiiM|uniref:MOSC domain-containing protein YiiM n=1 Tax=Planifilum fimeticola TaxID=201975 RepID=A0A2T0LJS4_9BACL|nr:MOSC domain-containing protein [Planifilum fimeticola]PRX42781.1 MOSC domain-containing protein YiiM [Planifilum fimeticola]